ncbi:hypothetical protein [Brucella intermedia]|nr:hypothetical protein [Brucella intermedia]
MSRPLKGGRYIRDADTGKLTKADEAKQLSATAEVETPAPVGEPTKKGK